MTDIDKQIIDLYTHNESLTCRDLDRRFGFKYEKSRKILKRNGLSIRNNIFKLRRKYSLDESFFEKIDTEEKAYILGFLYADGCIYKTSLIVNLCFIDNDILEKIKVSLKWQGPIKTKKACYVTIKDKKTYSKEQKSLYIRSQKLTNDLIKLGCVPRKSLILKFPTEEQVPTHLLSHFIRGYFDGDGSIAFYLRDNRLKQCVSMVSTIDFCTKLIDFAKNKLNIHFSIYKYPNNSTMSINISSTNGCKYFLDWLYKDATIYLDRKYDKYMNHYYPKTTEST